MYIRINKAFLLLAQLTILLSSCVKEIEPSKTIHFSVLGDSFSTFEGHVTPESNDVWTYYKEIGVTRAEQMWWSRVAQSLGWVLEYNNSFSGSLICNFNYDNYYGPHSFLHRMDNLGNPDVILVFGGNNELVANIPLGEYVYDNWTDQQLCTFRPALAYLLQGLRQLYPEAEVFFMADNKALDFYMESVHVITDYYEVGCIDLTGIEKSWDHPNAKGMTTIARKVVSALRASGI